MLEINNLTNFAVDKKLFSTVAKKVLLGENRETETISLAFIGKEEMQKLNKTFRKKNKPTDVLSFELSAQGGPASGWKDVDLFGEIVICPDIVKENAEKYKVSFKYELTKVFIHGILHLCGYDHEKSPEDEEIMNKKQDLYLSSLKL